MSADHPLTARRERPTAVYTRDARVADASCGDHRDRRDGVDNRRDQRQRRDLAPDVPTAS
jgi:hypothetical protein